MSDQPTDAPLTHPEEMKGTVEFKFGKFATITATGRTTPAGLIGAAVLVSGLLDNFQPDCAGRKWSISLFDRMIHAPGTFRSARSCSNTAGDDDPGSALTMRARG